MAADFKNMGYETVPKTVPWIKMAAVLDERVSEAPQPIVEFKMAADFDNRGYKVVMKTVSWIKMAAGLE